MDDDLSTQWSCGSSSPDGWWLRYQMAEYLTINSFGFMPVGDRMHDPLLYESAQCGAGTDVEAACNPSIIATCNATIGDVNNYYKCEAQERRGTLRVRLDGGLRGPCHAHILKCGNHILFCTQIDVPAVTIILLLSMLLRIVGDTSVQQLQESRKNKTKLIVLGYMLLPQLEPYFLRGRRGPFSIVKQIQKSLSPSSQLKSISISEELYHLEEAMVTAVEDGDTGECVETPRAGPVREARRTRAVNITASQNKVPPKLQPFIMHSMNHSRVSTNEEPLTRAKFRKLLGNRNTDSTEVCASQTSRGTQSSPRFACLLALLCAVIASLLTTTAADHTDVPQPLAEDKSNSHDIAYFVNTFVIVLGMMEGVVIVATIVLGLQRFGADPADTPTPQEAAPQHRVPTAPLRPLRVLALGSVILSCSLATTTAALIATAEATPNHIDNTQHAASWCTAAAFVATLAGAVIATLLRPTQRTVINISNTAHPDPIQEITDDPAVATTTDREPAYRRISGSKLWEQSECPSGLTRAKKGEASVKAFKQAGIMYDPWALQRVVRQLWQRRKDRGTLFRDVEALPEVSESDSDDFAATMARDMLLFDNMKENPQVVSQEANLPPSTPRISRASKLCKEQMLLYCTNLLEVDDLHMPDKPKSAAHKTESRKLFGAQGEADSVEKAIFQAQRAKFFDGLAQSCHGIYGSLGKAYCRARQVSNKVPPKLQPFIMRSMKRSRVSTNEEPLTRAKFRKLLGNRNTDSTEVCSSQTPRGTQSSPRFACLLALLCAVIASLLTTTTADHTDVPQPLAEDKSNSHDIAYFVNTSVIVATIVLGMMEGVAALLFAHIVAIIVLGMMEGVAALLLIGYLPADGPCKSGHGM
ncbi:hypothetical protein CYMTET_8909 [Cymbomonas tetramitiformis]|uniref:Uncharacterized protein n=1 Tax=Cymbomonas tetramitiformis TaxID=36881 RepID=A0AAE0GSJ5_9CHLO|nr:hypothetical protein CYMTET_8909 [Cymbomonas tetramitiformis]